MTRFAALVLGLSLTALPSLAADLPGFDFTTAVGRAGWTPAHDISALEPAAEGLVIRISGDDPYLIGPPRDYPAGQPLWLRVRLKAEQGGTGQVFYFTRGASEENSVRFPVRPNQWEDVRVPLPALGPGYRLRFDPPGDHGVVTVAAIAVMPRSLPVAPTWIKPTPPALGADARAVRSGELVLRHAPACGAFTVQVNERNLAIGWTRPLLAYLDGEQTRWMNLAADGQTTLRATADGAGATGGFIAETKLTDSNAGVWTLTQRFTPDATRPGAIQVVSEVRVDHDRDVVFLPLLVLLPGAGGGAEAFGSAKSQALFAGLEYLDQDEPSSSHADNNGPGALRQVPDAHKLTLPLMAVVQDGRYVGLMWETSPDAAAWFDSPDRTLGGGGHVLGLIAPGADQANHRAPGAVLPYAPMTLRANQPVTLRATILGGRGTSAVAAVQEYIVRAGLPEVPSPGLDLKGYAALASAGWLDSGCREAGRFRHALPGQFALQPALDAAIFMEWLAPRAGDAALAQRLRDAAQTAAGAVDAREYLSSGVGHVRYPVGPLLYGQVALAAARARQHGRDLLGRFEPDGTARYRPGPAPGSPDYGKTHFAPDANGLTAQLVATVLESATVSGDPQLLAEGLRLLRALDKFENTVPRGAQTWECPLHTPDILASAHLVRAYTLGYQLTGNPRDLELARYWAWTGVPFVYLRNPTGQPVGPYATIAVLGATNWVAPDWIGLPVQWCGLVYADALYRLAPLDPAGPWRQLADGITASGIQQTFPREGNALRRGLLPDSYVLRAQSRNDPGINPATVQACAVRFYRQPELYSFHCFRGAGLLVHAPGGLGDVSETGGVASFKVQGCLHEKYAVLIAGCKAKPEVKINGAAAPAEAVEYVADGGWLILRLRGDAAVEVK